jgi:hypothetical protein
MAQRFFNFSPIPYTLSLNIKKIAAVHGEEEQTLAFVQFLEKEGFSVIAPRAGETVDITSRAPDLSAP